MAKHEDPAETRAVFVDEGSCIGCKNCVWCAPATFRMEPEHGRSRVFGQWLSDEDDLQTAIDSCPVDCIHWVERSELPALEYVCQNKQVRLLPHQTRFFFLGASPPAQRIMSICLCVCTCMASYVSFVRSVPFVSAWRLVLRCMRYPSRLAPWLGRGAHACIHVWRGPGAHACHLLSVM